MGLIVDLGGLFLISLLAMWGAKAGVLSFPLMRMSSVNLVATRKGSATPPSLWLCAHIDSKSQTIPMLVRVASTVFFASFSVVVAVSIGMMIAFPRVSRGFVPVASVVSLLAVVAALPVVFCFISNKSDGALDNATGVAAVLLAVEQTPDSQNIGVVITSAEELGLAGARAFAASQSSGQIAINCDTIDDGGSFYCMASGRATSRLRDAVQRATGLRISGMIPGILADNVAFTSAGWESCTLSRGNISTLGSVHTSRDTSDRLQGTGIAQASSLIAAIVKELA